MAEVEEIYEEEQDVEEELEIEDAAIDEDEGEPEDKAESEDSDEIVVSIDGEEPPPQEEQAALEIARLQHSLRERYRQRHHRAELWTQP
jgi:hypothetical protein